MINIYCQIFKTNTGSGGQLELAGGKSWEFSFEIRASQGLSSNLGEVCNATLNKP